MAHLTTSLKSTHRVSDLKAYQPAHKSILGVVQQSYAIQSHQDFVLWLQHDVNAFIPHHSLIASWGTFNNTPKKFNCHYDVASSHGFNTTIINKAHKLVYPSMKHLHQTWCRNQRRWFVVHHLHLLSDLHPLTPLLMTTNHESQSLIVYGVSDVRSESECLYVFLSDENTCEVKDEVISHLMPHIDFVLRRLQCLAEVRAQATIQSDMKANKKPNTVSKTKSNALVTPREVEIIGWIKTGKTNQEIGNILHISQNTVKTHLKRLFQKLKVSRRAQLAAMLRFK